MDLAIDDMHGPFKAKIEDAASFFYFLGALMIFKCKKCISRC
jgi:hypothetical protein